MATLLLTTVGTALAGPIGGALGSLAGQSIDQGLFGRGLHKGPRLGDLSVQTSNYGSFFPRIYGRMRIAGTVIWATDLKEEEAIEGGGKSGPEHLTYRYSVSLAVALSSRPIQSVRRIWADGKLIRGEAGDFKVKTGFRLALGSEDQAMDPLIASIEGIDVTPAYRGLALAIFEELDLAEFGNRIPMLTFEVLADEAPVPLSDLLGDASGGLVDASSGIPVIGYAAHGGSISESLNPLIEVTGLLLAERNGRLESSIDSEPWVIAEAELGCGVDGEQRARIEKHRPPDCKMPAALTITFYDAQRDYQTGQALAASGGGGVRDERIELPAVLAVSHARQLAEASLVRRWQAGDRLNLYLPPSWLALRPGDSIQIEGSSRIWTIRSASVEGMVLVIEAMVAQAAIQPLPADPGRPVSEPDEIVGRSNLALFELPPDGYAPEPAPRAWLAASSTGLWKRLPVELALASGTSQAVTLNRRAKVGKAESQLDGRCLHLIDERSSVTVRLTNDKQILLNADTDALAAGSNLSVLGEELVQFGRAEQLGPGLFRLSRLLRGRRGTEWASSGHVIGEIFCLIDPATIQSADFPGSSIGAVARAIAHGVGDVPPLPEASRLVSGEAMRPPAPCHLKATWVGEGLSISWVRRSYANWAWNDAVGDSPDSFPELYRLTAQGPSGQLTVEAAVQSILLDPSQLPGQAGQSITLSVATAGAAALSHPTATTISL